MKKELDLCPMDNFILALFPNSKIYEDGVVCDFNLLKQKTIEIIKQGRDIEIDIHFNMDDFHCYKQMN